MAANYDPRIAAAFAALGYDVFPFAAFDDAGQPIVPSGVTIPEQYKATVGRIAQAPVWSEIYRAMSLLDNPDWRSYMAGLAFVGNDIRVAIFKSIASVDGDAEKAQQWALSYANTIEQTISEYGGRSHVVDPSWANVINDIIGILPPEEKAGDPSAAAPAKGAPGQVPGAVDPAGKTPGVGSLTVAPVAAIAKEDKALPAGATTSSSLGVPPLLLLGLKAMAAVLSKATVRTYVRSTVFWYTHQGFDVDLEWAKGWKPLHISYSAAERRAVHGIWNSSGPKPERPALICGNPKWRGIEVPDMPHDIWQWCQVFYPTANCKSPSGANVAVAQVS